MQIAFELEGGNSTEAWLLTSDICCYGTFLQAKK